MKSKLLLLLTLFMGAYSFAQTSAEAAGIAVQGIARDDNNTAKSNETVNLKFTIYYLDSTNQMQDIYVDNESLSTDSFGVFSHVVDPGAVNNVVIANTQAYLKIEEGQTVISDEPLKHVPYAISANNGVPTGAIMPFMGTTAPYGWVLCDGSSLTGVPGSQKLIDLLGVSNVPDLRGMFLRGAGNNSFNTVLTTLGAVQDEAFKSHLHNIDLKTTTNGNHNHNNGGYNQLLSIDGQYTTGASDSTPNEPNLASSATMSTAGDHNHDVKGNSELTGDNETRPVNYGVNYIIKL